MTTFTIVIVGLVGFVLGLYVASQIMEHISDKKQHEKFLKDLDKFDKRDQYGTNKT